MTTARFDHIAYGAEHPKETFATLCGRLGMEWIQWDGNIGFWALQAAFANGFKIEVIHPVDEHLNPFMRRFIDRWGNAPHHLTFRLQGIEAYIERLRGIGVEPVAVRLDTPAWREAFVHARGGIGILLQLAESDNDLHTEAPPEWTAIDPAPRASMVRLDHDVQDIALAIAILEILDGVAQPPSRDESGPYVDVVWNGDRVMRLREDPTLTDGRHRRLVVTSLRREAGEDPAADFVDEALGAVIGTQ